MAGQPPRPEPQSSWQMWAAGWGRCTRPSCPIPTLLHGPPPVSPLPALKGSSQSSGQRDERGREAREAAPSFPVAPLFRPQPSAGPGAEQPRAAGGEGSSPALGWRAGRTLYLVLIITQSA